MKEFVFGFFDVCILAHLEFLYHSGNAEQGAGRQPFRYVIALEVIEQGGVGYGQQLVLQLLQIAYPCYLLVGFGINKNKIPKGQVVVQKFAQFLQQQFGVLVDEANPYVLGDAVKVLVARLQQEGHKGIVFFDPACQAHAGLIVLFALAVKADIGNDAQDVFLVFAVNAQGLLVGTCQKNFRSSAHAHHLLVLVEALGHKFTRLLKQYFINQWQVARIKAH